MAFHIESRVVWFAHIGILRRGSLMTEQAAGMCQSNLLLTHLLSRDRVLLCSLCSLPQRVGAMQWPYPCSRNPSLGLFFFFFSTFGCCRCSTTFPLQIILAGICEAGKAKNRMNLYKGCMGVMLSIPAHKRLVCIEWRNKRGKYTSIVQHVNYRVLTPRYTKIVDISAYTN